jgi:5,10-methylene-tetrahydrofolate dehydrogenase/methenyl tetrahydrofolate cyclohydrolase
VPIRNTITKNNQDEKRHIICVYAPLIKTIMEGNIHGKVCGARVREKGR